MSNETDHISLANRNHKSLYFLLSEYKDHPEWVATVAFYKAVHVVEAVFHHKWNHNSSNHVDRLDRVRRTMDVKFFQDFDTLYQKSRIARYLEDSSSNTPYRTFTDHISPDEVVSELVGKRLARLEQMSLEHLSEQAKKSLQKIHVPDLPTVMT